MDSLDGGYMKLDLLTFHSQPQLNRMVLFFRSFWEYLFSVKRRKYQTRKVLMLSVVWLFSVCNVCTQTKY